MVKGKTKSGIKFQLDERIKDDARFLYYMAKSQDDEADTAEKSKAVMGMLKLIFGDDDGVISFMNTVASVNKGVCDTERMLSELTEMFDAINNKVENIFDNESGSVRTAFLRFVDVYGIDNIPLINIIQSK